MNFEEALADLIDKHMEREGTDGIITALQLNLDAMKDREKELIAEAARR